jgi:hypothetical protein
LVLHLGSGPYPKGAILKLKLGSNLIFGFGSLLAIGLSHRQQSLWFMLVLVPFVVWALLYAYEEINTNSWHYELVESLFKRGVPVCKSCPYWGLVVVSTIVWMLQYCYIVGLQLFIYLWHTIWLMFGYKPYWTRPAYVRVHDRVTHKTCLYKYKSNGSMDISRVFPIYFILPVGITLVILHIGTPQITSFYSEQEWYITLPVTYLAILALAGLVETWKVTAWPMIRWAYGKACPDVKFVEKQRVPADPQLPPATTNPH